MHDDATIKLADTPAAHGERQAAIVEHVASEPRLQAALWDHGLPIFPAEILENSAVGEPARRCWMVLWRWAGCKPGHVQMRRRQPHERPGGVRQTHGPRLPQ
jgi:hypothetical protein